MKRVLLTLAVVAALALFALPAFAENNDNGVTVGVGTLRIGGMIQSGLTYWVGQETLDTEAYQAVDRSSDFYFWLARARMVMAGEVLDEHVSYFMQMEFARDASAGFADMLLDAKIGFHYIPYTGIYVGRILPNFTGFAPRSSAQLLFIDYPLMNQYMFTTARQTGLDFGVKTTYLDANLGVFNGRSYNTIMVPDNATTPVGNANWGDQNNGKDIYINLVGKPPVEGLKIFAGFWYGTPLDYQEVSDGEITEHNVTAYMIDAGVLYAAPFGLTAGGEFLMGQYNWNKTIKSDAGDTDRADDTYELSAMSYYVFAGFNFGPLFEVPVELLVRYDVYDPDTLNDEKKHAWSEQDQLSDISVAINYYIKSYHAMLGLNYIHHAEAWEDVKNLAGDDTQTGISNDEIKLQAQVAF